MANSVGKAARTATESLQILWEEKYFTTWKRKKIIEEHLAKRGNHFSPAEMGMALMRAKQLTRRGKSGSYEYIQKYPAAVVGLAAKKTARGKL